MNLVTTRATSGCRNTTFCQYKGYTRTCGRVRGERRRNWFHVL